VNGGDVIVDGLPVHVRTGGVRVDDDAPALLLVHGAGMDGTIWSQQTRFLSMRGVRALAVDLPGHGRSAGDPLPTVPAMADWLVRLCREMRIDHTVIAGHSMGTFIALEVADRCPELVGAVVLCGTATAMPVHPALMEAAEIDIPRAAALMTGWSHAAGSRLGVNPTPGLWMTGGVRALVERSRPGVLRLDLGACVDYHDAVVRAGSLTCPVVVVIGAQDKMTPPKSSRALAGSMVNSQGVTVVELPHAGHMMLTEEPKAVREALLGTVHPSPD
jgi:pimeloyl-ACP methyl ester carboxylesterase